MVFACVYESISWTFVSIFTFPSARALLRIERSACQGQRNILSQTNLGHLLLQGITSRMLQNNIQYLEQRLETREDGWLLINIHCLLLLSCILMHYCSVLLLSSIIILLFFQNTKCWIKRSLTAAASFEIKTTSNSLTFPFPQL